MNEDLELFREYRRTHAADVRDRILERHMGAVKYAAASAAGRLPSRLRLDDLYSAGMLGFLDAIVHYDPDRGVPFASYAAPRIRGAILDELRRLDYVPRRTRRKLRDAERAANALRQELGGEPSHGQVAARLGVEVADYERLLGDDVTFVSLDASRRDDDPPGATPEGLTGSPLPSPIRALDDLDQRRLLGRIIDRLPERERQVLALYYYEELTMQDVGRVLGVTESRVSQLHSSAMAHLQAALRRERWRRADAAH
jgi:RNA polymerase sigma factor FliA